MKKTWFLNRESLFVVLAVLTLLCTVQARSSKRKNWDVKTFQFVSRDKVGSHILHGSSSDPWSVLGEDDLSRDWSEVVNVNQMKDFFEHDLELDIHVNIKLVGFGGESEDSQEDAREYSKTSQFTYIEIDNDVLLSYLDAILLKEPVSVLHEGIEGTHNDDKMYGGDSEGHVNEDDINSYDHELLVKKRYIFQILDDVPVMPGEKTLKRKLFDTLQGAMKLSQDGRIPASLIDDVIAADFQENHDMGQFTLYLLNIPTPNDLTVGSDPSFGASATQGYSYIDEQSRFFCSTMSWVGEGKRQSSAKDGGRYAWADLTAGFVYRGPSTSGDGSLMSSFNFPMLARYIYDGPKSETAVVDVARFVRKTANMLVAPNLYRIPRISQISNHANSAGSLSVEPVHIIFMFVHDHPTTSISGGGGGGGTNVPPPGKFNLDKLEEQLRKVRLLPHQKLTIETKQLSLTDNVYLSTAYTMALRQTLAGASLRKAASPSFTASRYLDSSELRRWLKQFEAQLLPEYHEVEEEGEPQVRVKEYVPVYLFDFEHEHTSLLDRKYQAVSYEDMVLAVQTDEAEINTNYQCEGYTVRMNADDATRAVLASTLSTVWGVVPTHEYLPLAQAHSKLLYNSYKVAHDFLWSVGNTPFGPFSSSLHLSVVIREAPVTNQILASLNRTATTMLSLLDKFALYGFNQVEDMLPTQDAELFLRRFHLLSFKFQETLNYVSLHEFNSAFLYLVSMEHDLKVITNLSLMASGQLRGYLSCSSTSMEAIRDAHDMLPPRIRERVLNGSSLKGWLSVLGPLSSLCLIAFVLLRFGCTRLRSSKKKKSS